MPRGIYIRGASAKEQFWENINTKGPIHPVCGRCWTWMAQTVAGYGKFWALKGEQLAHRASWIIHFGDIPNDLCVLHRCDNPSCVNPNHLFLGTRTDNSVDMVEKGRQRGATGDRHGRKTHPESYTDPAKGEQLPQSKLDETTVLWIRWRHAQGGISYADLGQLVGVCGSAIGLIIRRVNWKHLREEK